MAVLFPNANITVYHYENEKYIRTNITNVNLNHKRNFAIGSKGAEVHYTTVIIAPKGYPISTGDKIIIGDSTQDIERISELKGYITVLGVQENFLLDTLIIECK